MRKMRRYIIINIIWKNQAEILQPKNTIIEIKNVLKKLKNRFEEAENKISKLKHKIVEIIEPEDKNKK